MWIAVCVVVDACGFGSKASFKSVLRVGELVAQCPLIDLLTIGLLNEQIVIHMMLPRHSTKSLYLFRFF